ncbi:hypothetical protein C1646_759505 [Rhizophagus diaphanus]|nr:hypothetical protein C1646_759505 [Rhizophagus diaphanus] [Rhizophagus sp. MUCL 43196]
MSRLDDDIRVVVSIAHRISCSKGYSCAHKSNPNEIIVQENWEGLEELSDKPFLSEGVEYKKVPAEFDDDAISTMRECVFTAELTKDKFTEAVAIYCLYSMKGQYNLGIGASFMIVDCDGDTIDLTTRQLLDGNNMSEVTERTGDNFGSSFIDQEFVKFLGLCYWRRLEESDWLIEIEFEDIKAMFDPVIGRIIQLIRGQLEKRNKKCSALMLTGVFNESGSYNSSGV